MRHNATRATAALCALAAVLVLGGCGRDNPDPATTTTVTVAPGAGSDGHTELPDPLATATAHPDTAAVAALSVMFSWRPATDPSPGAALTRALPYLTGELADAARQTAPALLPPEWQAWARNLDALTAVAIPLPDDDANQTGDTTAQRVLEVRQTVLHTNGQTTPRQPMVIIAQLDRTDAGWQLADYRVDR